MKKSLNFASSLLFSFMVIGAINVKANETGNVGDSSAQIDPGYTVPPNGVSPFTCDIVLVESQGNMYNIVQGGVVYRQALYFLDDAIAERNKRIKDGQCHLPISPASCWVAQRFQGYSIVRNGKFFTPTNIMLFDEAFGKLKELVDESVCSYR